MSSFDLLVIGSGPAGYVAAIRAAQLGMKVGLVEASATLGGTCLNVGCIPSKALLDSSEKYEQALLHFEEHGIGVKSVSLNLQKMLERKDGVVKKLTGGIGMLMQKNKITTITGHGRLTGANSVDVAGKIYTAKNILLAVGSVPVELPFAKFDGKHIVSSTEALNFESIPRHLIVIGAGVIGLEMGSVWRRLGAEVTLLDVADRILTVMDGELGTEAQKIYTKQGLNFALGCKVSGISTSKSGAVVSYTDSTGATKTLAGDKVLVAVGRRANTHDVGLAAAGVKADARGVIAVNGHYQTNIPSIYAVGDCTPGPMLAHKGEEEGIACVERMAGLAGHVNYDAIPWVVYTAPELASVGLTEEQAKEKGLDYKTGKFRFAANGRALAIAETDGFVKLIADAKTDKLLGAHIIGHNASELIAETAVGMEFHASSEDIARSVHAHPTMSEAIKEAALAVDKRAIHG